MNTKKWVRVVSLILAILMIGSVLFGALSTLASATVISSKTTISLASAKQPQLTFYDIEGNTIGTFSHSSSSNLVGFDSAKLIYEDKETGEMVEKNYSRVDVKLFLYDKKQKYSNLSKIAENSFFAKYAMGSSTGSVFANKIDVHEGSDAYLYFDVQFENVAFRDSNKMKVTFTYQNITSKNGKRVLKNATSTGTISLSKAKLDNQIDTTKKKSSTANSTTNKTDSSYEDMTGGYHDSSELKKDDKTDNSSGDNKDDSSSTDTSNNADTGTGTGTTEVVPSVATPYLIIDSYSTGEEEQIVAGDKFPLSITCKNTSTDVNLENIVMKVTAAEGLQLADSTNIFYLPQLGKSGTFDKQLEIQVLANAEEKSHTIDVSFSYEFLVKNERQKGEMTQQIAIPTLQPVRFQADPVEDLMESSVGEEIYITGKYVNKSRGEIYNLSASITGNFPGAGKIQHVGNVAAGVSGDVEFEITPDTAGEMQGAILYTYEDAAGNGKSLTIPFQTTILEAPAMDAGMMGGFGEEIGMFDENGNPIDPEAGLQEKTSFLDRLKDPNSWELWAVVGGVVLVVVLITVVVIRRKKAAAEFEDDDETK